VAETTPALSGHEILKAVSGRLVKGDSNVICRGVSTDSRTVRAGNLFIALKGEQFDGHDFLDAAVKVGVSAVLVQEEPKEEVSSNVAVVLVEDTLKALGDLAQYWRNRFSIPVMAITGSSGKTTTKEMLAGIVGQSKNVLKTEGNLNNLIGMPMTLLRLTDQHEAAILELGTNQRGEIARLTGIAGPDIGLITNIGPAHLQGLHSLDTIREEKGDLFRCMGKQGTAVVNLDDGNIREVSRTWNGKRVTFSMEGPADVTVENMEATDAAGVSFRLVTGATKSDVFMNIAGRHHVYNALAAAAMAWALGMDGASIGKGLASFQPVAGRMDIRGLANGSFIIDDTYNANPASVAEALKALRNLRGRGRAIAVLGDMLELGEQSRSLHESIGEIAAQTGVDRLLLKGEFASATAAGALKTGMPSDAVIRFQDDGEAADFVQSYLHDGDWALVKGSRRMKMEQIVQHIVHIIGLRENLN
jgi:UDP-N-acetylmuramoyl-tripeptide--D-alanyl-D-alanine ligase